MRIIAGRYKGLKLTTPKGRDTRPTADRVKEALFSMLESLPFDFTGARALDFFAGSGALALEALSRGAASAVLADRDREALTAISRNLEALPRDADGPEAQVLKTPWPRGFQQLPPDRPFNLFLLDPPYDQTRLPLSLLAEAARRGLAAPGAVAVWEQAPGTLALWGEEDAAPWRLLKTRVWGGAAVAFLQFGESSLPRADAL
jgi:16S rRNA (guanine966-N2)-methyltransferase